MNLLVMPWLLGIGTQVLTDLCPSNQWLPYKMDCYLLSGVKEDWETSRNACTIQNAHMVRIDDADISTFLKNEMKSKDITKIWTGANDLEIEGLFVWEDSGDPFNYTDWDSDSPNNHQNYQPCVRLDAKDGWNDVRCVNSVTYNRACQITQAGAVTEACETGPCPTSFTPTDAEQATTSGDFDHTNSPQGHVESTTFTGLMNIPNTSASSSGDSASKNTGSNNVSTGNPTKEHHMCICCSNTNEKQLTNNQKRDIIAHLKEEPSISKTNTSASRRKLISVYDSRPSSVAIGSLGCFLLVFAVGLIIVPDMISIGKFLSNRAERKRSLSEI